MCFSGCQRAYPGLVDAASIIGGSAIQERATLGGNLCNAAPSGDAIPAMIVLGATCTIAGPEGTRTLPVEDICTNPGQTVLKQGEILVSIHFPPHPDTTGAAYLRFTPRREMDIAVAGAGAWVALSDDRQTILDARIALAAVAPTPLLVKQAGASLVGCEPDETSITKAAEAAQACCQSDYRICGVRQRNAAIWLKFWSNALCGKLSSAPKATPLKEKTDGR